MKKKIPAGSVLIPEKAVRVFRGKIFDVYQWEQELYDGSTHTFEMLKRPDTVEVILVRGTQILLVRDEQPNRVALIDFPGGRVDPGETWETAAKRELLEETGFSCSLWKLIDVMQPEHKLEWFIAIYVAQEITTEQKPQLDAGEKVELLWREFDEVRQAVLLGREPSMNYLLPFFAKVKSVDDLVGLPEYIGEEIER